jgi:hypothetical protein
MYLLLAYDANPFPATDPSLFDTRNNHFRNSFDWNIIFPRNKQASWYDKENEFPLEEARSLEALDHGIYPFIHLCQSAHPDNLYMRCSIAKETAHRYQNAGEYQLIHTRTRPNLIRTFTVAFKGIQCAPHLCFFTDYDRCSLAARRCCRKMDAFIRGEQTGINVNTRL